MVPEALDAWLEQRFFRYLDIHLDGAFADSNQRLEALAGLDLRRYGYQLPEPSGGDQPSPRAWPEQSGG